MIAKLVARPVLSLIGLLLLILALWAAVHFWGVWRNQAAQGRVDSGQAGAAVDAGVSAIEETRGAAADKAQVDTIIKGGSDAIRSAPGADAPVSPQSRDAALRASCELRLYERSRRCAELREADRRERAARGNAGD